MSSSYTRRYDLPPSVRARLAQRDTGSWQRGSKGRPFGVGVKCRRCREFTPFERIDDRYQICQICKADLVDSSYDERQRWTPGLRY